MIYKVHRGRVLSLTALLSVAAVLLFVLVQDPPRGCVRVSGRPPSRVLALASTETGHHLRNKSQHAGPKMSAMSAWFRTKIILPSSTTDADEWQQEEKDEEEEDDEETTDDESYDEDLLPENGVFQDGDFDVDPVSLGPGYLEPDLGIVLRALNNASGLDGHQRRERTLSSVNVEGVPIVEDGVVWSEELEKWTPKGSSDEEAQSALRRLRTLNVHRLEAAHWNRCGRPKNQFVVFEDGSRACVRYRAPHQYLVQGEVLSFYLSRLLGIHNVPAVSLATVGPHFQGMWKRPPVREHLLTSGWEVNTTVALIQWIEDLERHKLPPALVSCLEEQKPLSVHSSSILHLPTRNLTELLQWSDLIIFDYITGNYDRVASMQDAADKEGKPSILRETVHNLVRSKTTGGLWLIDNESGLLDSYSLLYGTAGKDRRFLNFHKRMLDTVCLFRRRTMDRIYWLHSSQRAGPLLMDIVRELEPLFAPVEREEEVAKRLQERIAEVYEHIQRCSESV